MLRSMLATRKSKRKFKLIMRVANSIMQHDELDEEYIDPVTLDSVPVFRSIRELEHEEDLREREYQYRRLLELEPLPF